MSDSQQRSASEAAGPPDQQPAISAIMNRTLTGACHPLNRGAVDWSSLSGLVAHGSNHLVVVTDPETLHQVQVLDKHKSVVQLVQWAKSSFITDKVEHSVTLASSDSTGHVIIWNVKSGEVKAILKGDRAVKQIRWLDGNLENTGHYLAALHPPYSMILWDTTSGEKIWRKNYGEALLSFDFDPFDPRKMALRCRSCILFVDDFNVVKTPASDGKKFYVSEFFSTSPSRTSGGGDELRRNKRRFRRMMKEIVMMSSSVNKENYDNYENNSIVECLQIAFHRASKDLIFLVYPREILLIDLEIRQTVGLVITDRSSSSPHIHSIIPCSQRDVLYILFENGGISMKARKAVCSTVETPSVSSTPLHSSSNSSFLPSDDSIMEIVYEQKATSEAVRLNKNAKVLGFIVNPVTEKTLCTFTSDGRMIFTELLRSSEEDENGHDFTLTEVWRKPLLLPNPNILGGGGVRFLTSAIHIGISVPPLIIRMCPPLTLKNWPEYRPLMAVASSVASSGNIQIYNVSMGKIEREFAVHTFPVKGLEWTGLHSVLSYAYQTLSVEHENGGVSEDESGSGGGVRNELVHTDIRTGRCRPLRIHHRSEESAIEMLRVSHLKQYFIVAFSKAPFELWNLGNLTLLRTMPRKFPPITALEWSPLHNLKSLKKKMMKEEEDGGDGGEKRKENSTEVPLIVKEHFVFTDPEGQLYHFSVEGNAIRDGTRVPAEGGLGTITYITWKSDHIVRGDSEGNINIWDVRTRASKNIPTGRGIIKKMRFAPGRGNMKLLVLHQDSVAIWDIKDQEMINELRTPKDIIKVTDIEWAASDRPVLATLDGCVKILSLSLSVSTSTVPDYPHYHSILCPSFLPQKIRANFQVMLSHQPWREKYSLNFIINEKEEEEEDEFPVSNEEQELVRRQIELMDGSFKSALESAESSLERCLILSSSNLGICESSWETDFWKVTANVVMANDNEKYFLDTKYGFVSDEFIRFQSDQIRLHQSKISGHAQRKKVIDNLLCLGHEQEGVRLLLETEPDNSSYYEDNLKACLVASLTSNKTSSSSSEDEALLSATHSTIKLVATNLISEGNIWEGVQLLCLIDKVLEACQYLQSYNFWDASLWLAKCRLDSEQFKKVALKFCDHCISQDRRREALLIYLSLREFVTVLDALYSAKMVPLAAKFLQICEESGNLPDSSHALVLREEISLAYARYLFDLGNVRGAEYYCEKADEKGEILKREFRVIRSKIQSEN